MAASLEPIYRLTFTTPESWSVQLPGVDGSEGQSFLIAEGRAEGGVAGRMRAANAPRRRVDGVLTPDFRGALETDDGATIVFAWSGLTQAADDGPRHITGGITHVTDDARYAWLNDVYGVVTGAVEPKVGGGFDVVLEIAAVVRA